MKKNNTLNKLAMYSIIMAVLLFFAMSLGAFGENCQQLALDMMIDSRSHYIKIQ